jgi:hypothetical protein
MKKEMKNLEKMTNKIARSAGDDTRMYVVLAALGVVCVFGILLLRKAKNLEKMHAL